MATHVYSTAKFPLTALSQRVEITPHHDVTFSFSPFCRKTRSSFPFDKGRAGGILCEMLQIGGKNL